jgi:periplasmic protein CpxP/Spy
VKGTIDMTDIKNLNPRHIALGALSVALVMMTTVSRGAEINQRTDQIAQAGDSTAVAPQRSSRNPGLVAGVEAQISALEKKLKITSAQKPQFDAYAEIMRANARSMDELFQQRAQHRDRSASGMLRWYAQLTTAHAEDLNKLVPAFDTLYASLSEQQKKVADKEFQTLRQARPPRGTRSRHAGP